jgi:hypothetical protein
VPAEIGYNDHYTEGGRSMIFTPEYVKARLREQPFVPVRIVTTTGQTYDIHHPDLVLVTVEFLMVGLPSDKNPTVVAGHVTRVALAHVTELRDLPRPVAPSSNGPAA